MRFNKFLPLILLAALAACGKGGSESAPANNAPAAENIAPAANIAPTPADHQVAAPAAPAAENAAAPTPTAAPAAPAGGQPASAAPAGGSDLAKGEQVFNGTCQACHGSGVMGAPKVGDKAAWGSRIAQGKETLYQHALNGIRMMPAHGGNPALADGDVKSAVDYMVSKAQ